MTNKIYIRLPISRSQFKGETIVKSFGEEVWSSEKRYKFQQFLLSTNRLNNREIDVDLDKLCKEYGVSMGFLKQEAIRIYYEFQVEAKSGKESFGFKIGNSPDRDEESIANLKSLKISNGDEVYRDVVQRVGDEENEGESSKKGEVQVAPMSYSTYRNHFNGKILKDDEINYEIQPDMDGNEEEDDEDEDENNFSGSEGLLRSSEFLMHRSKYITHSSQNDINFENDGEDENYFEQDIPDLEYLTRKHENDEEEDFANVVDVDSVPGSVSEDKKNKQEKNTYFANTANSSLSQLSDKSALERALLERI
ncbi:hypothetical protein PACTADRAFT_51348 [Pachysolen tannophilus NRRL Y-2460]|uniref:Uncharacterized protein n=1 Tax=Pachysolen tannophilus NRRL Y-2460 TaxID=669874 RepID=A0A1E4TPC2_PACTA|nr:hypothetical protein PACTADRAFT_51348 [Pachysolen tannophilus NRRL Y-2460]